MVVLILGWRHVDIIRQELLPCSGLRTLRYKVLDKSAKKATLSHHAFASI